MITDEDITIFTEGDCHVLAGEIHRRTGWDFYCFWDEYFGPDFHAFIVTPDGLAVDVNGFQSMKQFKRRWSKGSPGTKEIVKVDAKEILSTWDVTFDSEIRAEEIADYLLEGVV